MDKDTQTAIDQIQLRLNALEASHSETLQKAKLIEDEMVAMRRTILHLQIKDSPLVGVYACYTKLSAAILCVLRDHGGEHHGLSRDRVADILRTGGFPHTGKSFYAHVSITLRRLADKSFITRNRTAVGQRFTVTCDKESS
jgi:hypothetical protein